MPRPARPADYRLLTKVSKLYYEQNLTQQEISERLHLSRPKVSRLLQQAQEQGIIQITVRSPRGSHTDVEHRVEQRFGLKEVVAVEIQWDASPEVIARELGIAAAQYVHRTLADGDVIGLSWGTTLNAMLNALAPVETHDVHVVQIIGGLGAPEAEVHATDICRRFARLLDGRLTLISAPGIADTLEIKRAFLSDSHVQHAFDLFPTLTLALVGIGVPHPESVVMRDGSIMSRAQLDDLRAQGAVGDIGLRFFDAAGLPIPSSLNDRVIGITLEQLRRVERVVGIAGGMAKFEAICAALRGQLVNVLITDTALASRLADCTVPLPYAKDN